MSETTLSFYDIVDTLLTGSIPVPKCKKGKRRIRDRYYNDVH